MLSDMHVVDPLQKHGFLLRRSDDVALLTDRFKYYLVTGSKVLDIDHPEHFAVEYIHDFVVD